LIPPAHIACAGILEQSIGDRNRLWHRVVVPALQVTYRRQAGTRFLAPRLFFCKIPSLAGRYGNPIPTYCSSKISAQDSPEKYQLNFLSDNAGFTNHVYRLENVLKFYNSLWGLGTDYGIVVPARASAGVLEESMEARNPLWHRVVVPALACASVLEQFMEVRNRLRHRVVVPARACTGVSEQSMGATNIVEIGLSYRPVRLHRQVDQ
jgi:hypothetical protein